VANFSKKVCRLFLPCFLLALIGNKKPLDLATYNEILRSYTIIGDFSRKSPTRDIGEGFFWRYPYQIPAIKFPINADYAVDKTNMILTPGVGRDLEHINLGRKNFMEGDFELAKKTFLTARASFGEDSPYHKRIDLYLGMTFLHMALALDKPNPSEKQDVEIRTLYNNAATFFAWALIRKKDSADPHIDKIAHRYYYYLTAIYYRYGKYATAYSVAQEGLNFLRQSGHKEFRPHFHRILAESFIENKTYEAAVVELDKAIRLDPDETIAPMLFARIADIYFHLNNYELAEDFYGIAIKIARDSNKIAREQMVLRAESLFWLKKTDLAIQNIEYALNNYTSDNVNLEPKNTFLAFARLRLADVFLQAKEVEKAKIAYYQTYSYHPSTDAAKIARVRSACLELPYYKGNNIAHARKLLEVEKDFLPAIEGQELAYACYVNSFAQHERDETMIAKISEFFLRYPYSDFIKSMIPPVQDFHYRRLLSLFDSKDYYGFAVFFESNADKIINKLAIDDEIKAFKAHALIFQTEKAERFYAAFSEGRTLVPEEQLLQAAFVIDRLNLDLSDKKWMALNLNLAAKLNSRLGIEIDPTPENIDLLQRSFGLKSAIVHAPWMYKLSTTWAEKNSELLCGLSYPILSKINSNRYLKFDVSHSLLNLINMHERLKPANECISYLFDMEMSVFANRPEMLWKRYEARILWKMDERLAAYFWQVAQLMKKGGMDIQYKALLDHIVEQAPANSIEKEFAKLALDKSKFTTEYLWNPQ
jgi:tetratricopeptide (TPR) repeat protein